MEIYDRWLFNSDDAICRNIDTAAFLDRGFTSVNILSQLRNLLDHLCVKLYVNKGFDPLSNYYQLIKTAVKYVHTESKYRYIYMLHDLLQISASHYTLDPDSSERLMLKYYEYLLHIKNFMFEEYGITILHNLDKFPLDIDPEYSVYHKAIADEIDRLDLSHASTDERRYYIYKIKPVFIEGRVYYEVTFSPASERASKFDRVIAFTKLDILPNYATYMRITQVYIDVVGVKMPVLIIVGWRPAIRVCEFRNLAKIFGLALPPYRTNEYENTMDYIFASHCSLLDIINYDDSQFGRFLSRIQAGGTARHITTLLLRCRRLIMNNAPGCNVVRYLLYRMNNKIIKDQLYIEQCSKLSNLWLKIGSKPFDQMPFSFSLINHNPVLHDLFSSIDVNGHEPELLAKFLTNNAEHHGMMYTPLEEIKSFADVRTAADCYNSRLYHGHGHAKIELFNNNAYIFKYDENVYQIIQRLKSISKNGISGYTAMVDAWLSTPGLSVDCPDKRMALRNMFVGSRVAFIYGAAGTGKTMLIDYLSNIFNDKDKLYLANTNPAVENLKRRIKAANSRWMTIYSYLKKGTRPCDVLFIDECSTVSNDDMLAILERRSFNLLVLVGDMYQIESIRFGNWFGICNSHFKGKCKIELKRTYRTNDSDLKETWNKVRNISSDMLEHITRNGYSHRLDDTIFSKSDDDEIILCLNYGGLYGINNINRFLQSNNPGEAVRWGIHTYKKGDPILFVDTERFPKLYNNLKGEIIDFCKTDNSIVFTLKVYTVFTDFDLEYSEIEFVSSGDDGLSTIIRIGIDADEDGDSDIDTDRCIVPFQIAYAISIHKAQGLEYQSVKVVITHDVEDMITHNIFYTAITRTREKLKIYWTPETENKILKKLRFQFNKGDYTLLKAIHPDIMKS